MMHVFDFAFMPGLGVAWKHLYFWTMNVLYYVMHSGESYFLSLVLLEYIDHVRFVTLFMMC